MSSHSLSELKQALIATGVTGPHQSHPRRGNISKIHSMIDDDLEGRFGLSGIDRYSAQEVLGFVGDVMGCSIELEDPAEDDLIDPDKTIAGIVAAGERLRDEAQRGSVILAATGHPTGLLEHHMRIVDAFTAAGGKVLRLREGEKFPVGPKRGEVRYIGNVGTLAVGASLLHTHSSIPMEALLEAGPWPDLVLGDHGWAGAAVEKGIPAIAVIDINDPALAVARAEGRDITLIPMDDNRQPRLYEPIWRYLEGVIGGAALPG